MPAIGASVIHNAGRVPDRIALVVGRQRWTWAEIDREVAQVAARLRSAGLGVGDRFAMVTGNTSAAVISYFAAARLGAIVVPVNARLAAPEITHIVNDAGATVIASAPELDSVVDAAVADVDHEVVRFSLDDEYAVVVQHPAVA
ncbi:AMP-binding protein [Sphaerisporangium sp. NPDC051017]|uniref:AMP-binding protein n=1 Tax=Sphaerisporangium sp. NPDC051017 TaxID=3154636 RepID=UPI00342FE3D9